MQQRQKERNRKLEEDFEAKFINPQKPRLPPKMASKPKLDSRLAAQTVTIPTPSIRS